MRAWGANFDKVKDLTRVVLVAELQQLSSHVSQLWRWTQNANSPTLMTKTWKQSASSCIMFWTVASCLSVTEFVVYSCKLQPLQQQSSGSKSQQSAFEVTCDWLCLDMKGLSLCGHLLQEASGRLVSLSLSFPYPSRCFFFSCAPWTLPTQHLPD